MFARAAKVPLPDQVGNLPRVAAVHTPRPQYALLPPPAAGTTWSWQPEIIGADGADAGPNGIIETVRQDNSEYNPIRGHCSVHKKRNVQQNKTKIFEGEHDAKESKANALTTLMEDVKSHSITIALAELGKRKITEHLEETDSDCVVALLRIGCAPVPQNHRAEQRLLMAWHAAHPQGATAATSMTGRQGGQTGQV